MRRSFPAGPLTRDQERDYSVQVERSREEAIRRQSEVDLAWAVAQECLRARAERLGHMPRPTPTSSTAERRRGYDTESRQKPFSLKPDTTLQDVYGLKVDVGQKLVEDVSSVATQAIHRSLNYLFLPQKLVGYRFRNKNTDPVEVKSWSLSENLVGIRRVVPRRGQSTGSMLAKLNSMLTPRHRDLEMTDKSLVARFINGRVLLSNFLVPAEGGKAHDGWRLAAFFNDHREDPEAMKKFADYPHRVYLLVYCGQSVEPYPKGVDFYNHPVVGIDSNDTDLNDAKLKKIDPTRAMLGIVTHDNADHPVDLFVVSHDSTSHEVFRTTGGVRVELIDREVHPKLYTEALSLVNSIADATRRRMLVAGLGAGLLNIAQSRKQPEVTSVTESTNRRRT